MKVIEYVACICMMVFRFPYFPKMKKETRSYDIKDRFRRQNETDSKRLRAGDKNPKIIIRDSQLCLRNRF